MTNLRKNKTVMATSGLVVVLVVLAVVSFAWGRYSLTVPEVCKILFSRVISIPCTWTSTMEQVVLSIRLPRILLSCMVGCCLSAAGAAYQGVFQNPMAAPYILGASSGAGFGAALAIITGASGFVITASAFVCSLATVAVAFLLAQRAPGRKVVNLVLAGMIVGSLLNAGTSYLKLVADPNSQLPAITYWLMGSLNNTTMTEVAQSAPVMLAGLLPLFLLRWKINILTMGDDEAKTLGINTSLLRLVVIVCATLVTASSIAVAGMIGWVGLVVPHMCRKLVGSNFKALLPTSMLAGAAFLLLVDDISRTLYETELPIGILTAVVGAPFFLYLMLRKEGNIDA
ncbi:MAG: iron ABC transporter permease [Oscillospiraceae bacterium]|nr:iron ABC transporter permease [Oscillospiraceae bacterium]